MKAASTLGIIAASVLLALGTQNFILPQHAAAPTGKKETAYDRVTRTNTLRCAYALYPPFVAKDANTGKLSGIMPEVMNYFEQASGIKVIWEPEIDWGTIAVTLQSGKADAFCAGMYMTPKRGLVMQGSTPIFLGTVEAFVRKDDIRFDNALDLINQPNIKIEVNAGDLSEEIAQRSFPQAQRVYKGEYGGESQLFMDIALNKADLTLSGPSNLSIFNQNNPTMALRKVVFDRPLMAFPSVIAVDFHEASLLPLINATLNNLHSGGIIEKIVRAKTGADYGNGYFVAKPTVN